MTMPVTLLTVCGNTQKSYRCGQTHGYVGGSLTGLLTMQDWESMTQLLLDDKCGIQLTSTDEVVLMEIISCAVRRATGTSPPAGRAKGKVS